MMRKRIITSIFFLLLIFPIVSGKEAKAATIRNNGLGGIVIDINNAPYNDSRWRAYGDPYGSGGCTWFVGARVMQLTGKGSYNTQVGRTWYNSYGASLGFSTGQTIKAPAVICWSGHVAILEKIEGNTAYISEGGNSTCPGNSYTTIKTVPVGNVAGLNGGFIGYVYLGVNQKNDTTAPQISNIKVSDVNRDGYTVTCTVSDNVGVTKVLFPSWNVNKHTGYDAVWLSGTISGNTASCRVNIIGLKSGLVEGTYLTHIYAYDATGNYSSASSGGVFIDRTNPVISDVSIMDLNSDGYIVRCKATDANGIDRVQFPTWTGTNGQDDLAKDWGTNKEVMGTLKNDGYYYFQVKKGLHNNESKSYITHIYAYDKYGNSVAFSSAATSGINLPEKIKYTVSTGEVVKVTDTLVVVSGSISPDTKTDLWGCYLGTSETEMKKYTADKGISGTSEMKVRVENLSPGTNYYYKMWATIDGVESVGEIKKFTTALPAPNETAKPEKSKYTVSTGNIVEVTDTLVVVSGSISPDAKMNLWGCYLGTSESAMIKYTANNGISGTAAMRLRIKELKPGTTYYYKMWAIVDGVESVGEIKKFATALPAPNVQVKATELKVGDALGITWTSVNQADYYVASLCNNAGTVVEQSPKLMNATNFAYNFKPLLETGIYYVYVESYNNAGFKGKSPVTAINCGGTSSSAQSGGNSWNNSSSSSNSKKGSVHISWKSQKGASGYQVQCSTNNRFTQIKANCFVKKNSVVINSLKKGKKYYIRIRKYKTRAGKKSYGKWGKTTKVKAK